MWKRNIAMNFCHICNKVLRFDQLVQYIQNIHLPNQQIIKQNQQNYSNQIHVKKFFLCIKHGILTLDDLFTYEITAFMFKYRSSQVPYNLNQYFCLISSTNLAMDAAHPALIIFISVENKQALQFHEVASSDSV